jgi:hypothetical protein
MPLNDNYNGSRNVEYRPGLSDTGSPARRVGRAFPTRILDGLALWNTTMIGTAIDLQMAALSAGWRLVSMHFQHEHPVIRLGERKHATAPAGSRHTETKYACVIAPNALDGRGLRDTSGRSSLRVEISQPSRANLGSCGADHGGCGDQDDEPELLP